MTSGSSILAWRLPWTEEPGGLQFTGSQIVGHDWTHTSYRNHLWEPADPHYRNQRQESRPSGLWLCQIPSSSRSALSDMFLVRRGCRKGGQGFDEAHYISIKRKRQTLCIKRGHWGQKLGFASGSSFLAAPAMVVEGSGPERGTSYGSHAALLEIPLGDRCFTRP